VKPFPNATFGRQPSCGERTGRYCRRVCGDDEEFFELQTQLLDIEREYRGMTRRAGIFDALEDRLKASQYGGEKTGIDIRTKARENAATKADRQMGNLRR
jgi:DNA sulfur modification protein DndC